MSKEKMNNEDRYDWGTGSGKLSSVQSCINNNESIATVG